LKIPRVQIAGIKNIAEAQMCIDAGADGFGLLLMLDYPRGDAISRETAKKLSDYFRHHAKGGVSVLITHSTDCEAIAETAAFTGVDAVQVHNDSGDEISIDDLRKIKDALPSGTGLIKVLHIPDRGPVETGLINHARQQASVADALILDTKAVEIIDGREYTTLGGTGCANDRDVAWAIVEAVKPCPVIYAGGLNPENVAEAISFIKPYGVDVNSGARKQGSVEKDPAKVAAFARNAWKAFENL
jgi:phosphoribosylanthranilate isomerase